MSKKNIYILSFQGISNPFLSVLWPSAKTFYERHGLYPEKYNWVLPVCELTNDVDKIKNYISKNPPDVFGVGLYVWNFEISLEICKWVRENYPNCIIITGGPHQYFKHNKDWFVKHDFIDASLPSEIYGEIAIADILNNLTDDNKIDWNTVEKMVYPLSFDRSCWLQSPKATYKRDFKWDYAPYHEQQEHIDEYVRLFYEENSEAGLPMLHWKLETTRGCPYACTFCDWGGGVGSKTIVKDIEHVKKDIDVLVKYGIATIYVCDANFGINGERDVKVVEYIASKKKESKYTLYVHYGGYAKTNKHFDILKRIFTIEAENNLSYLYKISVQSFDQETLNNIKRTDLRKEEHWELADYLRDTYGYEAHVELIVGLPGMTLDKWYDEFTVPYIHDAEVRAYEWHLLPESEAYSKEYRDKFGIVTSKKLMNNSEWHIPAEIVVQANTYTRKEYKDMWIVHGAYLLFHRGGIYKKTIKDIINRTGIPYGKFLKKFYEECYPKLREANLESFVHFENHLDHVIDDKINNYRYTMYYSTKEGQTYTVFFTSFFLIEYFKNFRTLEPILQSWLLEQGANPRILRKDSDLIMSEDRMNKTKFRPFNIIRYNKFPTFTDFLKELNLTMTYSTTGLLVADTWI